MNYLSRELLFPVSSHCKQRTCRKSPFFQ